MNQSNVLLGMAILVSVLVLLGLALAIWENWGRGEDNGELLDAEEWQRRYDTEHGEEWDG